MSSIQGRFAYKPQIHALGKPERAKELKDDDQSKNKQDEKKEEKKPPKKETELGNENDVKSLNDAFYPPVQIRIEKLYKQISL